MGGKSPLVSVGIPTYNRASSLYHALDSILAQDYTPLEIVISDNASTDETEAVCRELSSRHNNVRYVRQLRNLGLTRNFSETLRHASGEYFMWLADDDFIEPGYLGACARVLAERTDHALVCGTIRYHGGRCEEWDEPPMTLQQDDPVERVAEFYRQVRRNGSLHGLMRRRDLLSVPFEATVGDDWNVVASMAFLGKLTTVDGVLLHRSIGASGNVEEMVDALGLSPIVSRHFGVSLIMSVFRSIAWRSSVYETLGRRRRLVLATRSAASVASWRHFAFIWPQFVTLWGLRGRLQIRTRLQRLLRRVHPS
jgi:glycosyltransferase involved in cell wall biosynthesis